MIYPPNFPPDYSNPAEKKVYEALAGLPGEDYDVFFHKTFSGTGNRQDDDYEIDFLVADLRNGRLNGIMVIEVKGGYMSYSGVENCWYQSGRRLVPGPDDQARKLERTLLKLVQVEKVALSDIVILVDGHTNEHPLCKAARIGPYPLEAC